MDGSLSSKCSRPLSMANSYGTAQHGSGATRNGHLASMIAQRKKKWEKKSMDRPRFGQFEKLRQQRGFCDSVHPGAEQTSHIQLNKSRRRLPGQHTRLEPGLDRKPTPKWMLERQPVRLLVGVAHVIRVARGAPQFPVGPIGRSRPGSIIR